MIEDDSIIICPADHGKAVVIEARDMYLIKTQHHIIEKDDTLMVKMRSLFIEGYIAN